MNRANWRVGLPQLGQAFFVSDGRGSGDGGGVVGGRPSDSSVTMANVDLLGPSSGDARGDVYAQPMGSNNIEIVLGELRALPNVMPIYSSKDLVMLAKRLIVLATRTPWVNHPILSAEPGYAERWQAEIPARAAFYFPRAVAVAAEQISVLCVATFLESRCDDIYDPKALLFMFGGCIAALPPDERASPIMTLLSAMVRRPDLCDAQKLPDRLKKVRQAIDGLSRDQFGEVYRSLCAIEGKMKERDPQSQIGGNFIRGVCDLYFANSGEILP